MNKTSQLPRNVFPAQSQQSLNRQPTLQPKMAGGQLRSPAMNQANRTPVAPSVYRPQPPAPKAVQPKMRAPAQAVQTRPAAYTPSGVVQANIVGGAHALQARLSAWRTPAQLRPAHTHSVILPKGIGNGRQTPGQDDKSPTIQRKSSGGVEAFKVPLRSKSGGYPLPDKVRAKMEAALGADFSDVRIHVGQEASSIGAIAYTWGTNIHFAPGQYNPHTIQGQKLLGHELWHVVQQKSGRVSNPFGGGVAVVQDHSLEAEADRMGVKAALSALVQRPGDKQ